MKWLIACIAVFMFSTAQAEQIDLSFQSKSGECRWYVGTFSSAGGREQMTGYRPKVLCRLVDHVGVTCYLKDHGLEARQPSIMKFVGNFRDGDDGLLIDTEADDRPFRFVLTCTEDNGCLFRFWNTERNIGYSCNLMKWTPEPVKPEPKAPPLLRKDAKPYASPKSAEVGV
jgi:hypothetical protein